MSEFFEGKKYFRIFNQILLKTTFLLQLLFLVMSTAKMLSKFATKMFLRENTGIQKANDLDARRIFIRIRNLCLDTENPYRVFSQFNKMYFTMNAM